MKSTTGKIVIGIVVAVLVFIGGVAYGKSASTASSASARGTFAASGAAGFSGAGRTFARGGGAGAGAIVGQIVSVDPSTNSISVQLPASTSTSATTGSTVVLFSPSTMITKTVAGSESDLAPGDSVVVQGSANSDGSMTAASIQVRPAPASSTGM